MRKKIFLLAFASIGLASPASAHDSIFCLDGWYLRASGSVDWHRNVDGTTAFYSFEGDTKVGWDIGGSVGMMFDQWRAEAEVYYRDSDFKHINVANVGSSGGGCISDLAAMANLYYDICAHNCFKIYFGGGVGIDFNFLDINSFNVNVGGMPGSTNNISENDVTFAWQLLAGIIYAMTERFDIVVGYRWFAHTKPDGFNLIAPGAHATTPANLDNFLYSHNVEAGIRFRF